MSERSRMIDLTEPVERAFLIGLDNATGRPVAVMSRSLAEPRRAGRPGPLSAAPSSAAPSPIRWYFGKGRAPSLVDEKAASSFNLLVVDDEPGAEPAAQPGDTARLQGADRSALIIDIFARHARTREGGCRSSLAALQYHLPRLTRMRTHLSRTAGGIGTRGPEESRPETDRRLIREKIRKVRTGSTR